MSNRIRLERYQARAIKAAIAALNRDRKSLIVGPTGSGKTHIIGAVINAMPSRARVLVVQNTLDLVGQNAAKLKGFCSGRSFATAAAGLPAAWRIKGAPATADCVVATIGTITGPLLDHVGRFDLLIIDEAHHGAAPTYRALEAELRRRNRSLAVFGTTATPERSDRIGLDELFGDEPSDVITIAECVRAGRLVKPQYQVVADADLAAAFGVDDVSQIRKGALRVAARGAVDHWLAHAQGLRSVMFCASIAAAEDMAKAFQARGIEAVAVSEQTPIRERKRIVDDLAADRGATVVTNAMLLTEGFDAPPVRCVGLARSFASKSAYIQAVGRGLRAMPGKNTCVVLDYVGAQGKHGDLMAGVDLATLKGTGKGGGSARGEIEVVTLDAFEMVQVDIMPGVNAAPAKGEAALEVTNGDDKIASSRAEAIALGLGRYVASACKRCGCAVRFLSNFNCCRCSAARSSDPEFKAKQAEWVRARRADPEFRARRAEKARARRAADPEWRAKMAERDRARRADPEYKARKAERDRARRAAKKAQQALGANGIEG